MITFIMSILFAQRYARVYHQLNDKIFQLHEQVDRLTEINSDQNEWLEEKRTEILELRDKLAALGHRQPDGRERWLEKSDKEAALKYHFCKEEG